MMNYRHRKQPTVWQQQSGFTLIELVVVMVVIGIVAGMSIGIVAAPMRGYDDLQSRAGLLDRAEGAIQRVVRDLRRALPNSIRPHATAQTIEFFHVIEAARYRKLPSSPGPIDNDEVLDVSIPDDKFNILGQFQDPRLQPGAANLADWRFAINTTSADQLYADVWAGLDSGMITAAANDPNIRVVGTEHRIELNNGHTFGWDSPTGRIYAVDTPITFSCGTMPGTLVRYWDYIGEVPPLTPPTGSRVDILTDQVTSCEFTYTPGFGSTDPNETSLERAGVVVIELELQDPRRQGNLVSVVRQVHVDNSP